MSVIVEWVQCSILRYFPNQAIFLGDLICVLYPVFTNPRMHLFHIPQCSIQNRNVYISVLNGAFWDMEQVHSGICELGQCAVDSAQLRTEYPCFQ